MAIALVGSNIEVAGYKSNGTATSGTATTLTDTGKAWTVNAYAEHIVWIISGMGAGATGLIASNTATVLTVDGFFKVNASGSPVTNVTPDATSVYAVAWTAADAIAAVPANCAWDNAATTKTMRCDKGILVKAGGAYGGVKTSIVLTTADTVIQNEAGSLFQHGRFTTSFSGVDGGNISYEKTTSAYLEVTVLGFFKLYGCNIFVNKSIADSVNAEIRYNIGASPLTHDGVHLINVRLSRIMVTGNQYDVFIRVEFYKTTFNVRNAVATPAVLSGVTLQEGVTLGSYGGDFFGYAWKGVSAAGAFNRPIALYQSSLPNSVHYQWRPDFGAYTSLSDVCDWYTSAPFNGIVYIGTTLALTTKTSAGADLGAVAVGVVKTTDGVGQIITGKNGSGSNFSPIKARFITTDANGDYAGPFGSDEGIFLANAKLTYTSRYVSAVTDYSGYLLILTKYGYSQQVLSRSWAYNVANAETAYLVADAYVSAAYATAIAYSGITMTAAAKTLVLSGARTFQEFYDFIKARVDYEAKTNDVHVVDPLTTTDGINYTLASDWTLTPINYLTWSKRIGSGKLIYTTVGTYSPMVGTIALEFTAATGTYDLRNADITGTVTLTNTGGGSITVQLPVGVTVVNTGPNITVDQSASVNIVISGFSTTSRLQIYDVNATTELYNDVPGATSKTLAVTYTADKPIRIRVADDGSAGANAMEFIETSQTLTSTGLSYGVTQVADDTYNSNAIDGSTVTGITITPSPARVAINIAGGAVTWPQIYAYQVYWLSTATGIADEAAFIEGVDTANYILTNFDIKNTNANPLTITGGWGRDSVTLTIAGCIDTAGSTGNIFCEPDHVVAYATGSALTAGQAASLAAIESVTNQFNFTVANQVDANALTGGGGLDAAGVRTAVGLASANLDTQLGTIAGYTDTLEASMARVSAAITNKHVLNPADGTVTIYDDDGTTILYSGLAYTDAAGTVLYNGTAAVHHTTRLT